jgi:peptidyl-tRNA hydrolase
LLAVTAETVEREPPEKSPADLAPAIDRAVVYLENHRESSRIKKLLFATCKNRWENDPAAIDSYGLKNIILELQQNYPTITALKRALEKIVSNINKKALYVAVADTIVLNCEPLYDGEADYEDYGDGAADGSLKTQIVPLRERFDLPPRESFPNANDGDFSTSIVDFEESRPITELHLSDSTPLPSTVPHKEYDPFELRLEIFQFTNPLRVKILLYSILFTSWEQGGQDWVTLRHYTLEEMLEQLIQSGRSIKEIEAQLHDAARTQLDREANVQTAGTLVQALQRIF